MLNQNCSFCSVWGIDKKRSTILKANNPVMKLNYSILYTMFIFLRRNTIDSNFLENYMIIIKKF